VGMRIGPKHSVSPQLTELVKATKNEAALFSSAIPKNLRPSRHKFEATTKPPKNAMHAASVAKAILKTPRNIAGKTRSVADGFFSNPPKSFKKNPSLRGKNVEKESAVGMNLFALRPKTRISKHPSS
jgi:hypothetical protein